ncbi:MAG: hypothetical protein ACRDOM_03275 [Nocardioides sp.]
MSFIPLTMVLVTAFVALVPLAMAAVMLTTAVPAPVPDRKK